jgi:hypothetical protein
MKAGQVMTVCDHQNFLNMPVIWIFSKRNKFILEQKCTIPWQQSTIAITFFMVAPKVRVFLVGNLFHATLLAPGIFRVFLGFREIYASMFWKFIAVFLSNGRSPSLTYLLAYLLTVLLTLCSSALLEKLTGFAASQEIPCIYGTRSFITAYTNARRLSLYWTLSNQSVPPHPLHEDPS